MAIQNPNASVQTPADLVNDSLRRVGFKKRIADLYDGSEASKVALDLYGQTRDQMLHENDWDFADRSIAATLLKQAPAGGYIPPNNWNPATNPIVPSFFYEYQYPSDCIKLRAITAPQLFVLDFDPQPNVFTEANDSNYNPPQRVVLCNVAGAMFIYTARVTDLSIWESDAIETFAATLGRRLAPALMGIDFTKLAAADEAQAESVTSNQAGAG